MRTVRLFNHHVHTVYYCLAVVELLLFVLSFYLGVHLYFLQEGESVSPHISNIFPRAAIFAVMTISAMAAMGLYKPQLREGSGGVLLRLMSAFVITLLTMSLLFYLLPNLYLWRGIFAQSVIMAFVFAIVSRWIFPRVVDLQELKTRVLVLGAGERACKAVHSLRRGSDRRGFRFVGFVPMSDEPVLLENETLLDPDEPLSLYATKLKIDRILVAADAMRGTLPIDELVKCRLNGIEVLDITTFFEREAGKIMLDFINPGWLVFSDGFGSNGWAMISKRCFDLVTSFLLLMLTWPIMMLVVIAIWVEDGLFAPVVYRQRRVGWRGREFDLLKLRSMRVDAEGDGKARWADKQDSRITRVGRFIRRTRIDELPQIINILAGDMSLVGPRPERPEFVCELSRKIPYYEARHQVKPGIAGWAQLHYPYGASEEDARQKLQYELYYVKNRSLFLDFLILLTTTEVVLFGAGAR